MTRAQAGGSRKTRKANIKPWVRTAGFMPHVREKCKGVFVIRQTYNREKRGVATKRVDSDSRGYGMFFTSRAEAIKKAYKFRVLVELGRKPKRHDAEASSRGDTASLDASIITPSVSFTSVDYGVAGPPAEAAPPTPQSKRKEKVEKVHRDRRATNTAKQKKAIAEATRRATRREQRGGAKTNLSSRRTSWRKAAGSSTERRACGKKQR